MNLPYPIFEDVFTWVYSNTRDESYSVMTELKSDELAMKLMEFETVSPVEDQEIFDFLADYLEENGVESEIHTIGGVKNLTAEIGEGETDICFNGHLDVVAADGEWTVTEPFNPKKVDGRLYGRGAADMKSGVAAMVNAFLDLSEDFEGRATLMVVGDEEIGGDRGSEPLVKSFIEDGHGFDYAIVGEPTDLNVQVGTRGAAWFNLRLFGEEKHASRAYKADNVMEDLPAVLEALNGLELTYEEETDLVPPSIEVTSVRTDETYNSIPGEVEIRLDARYVPGQSMRDLENAINDATEHLNVEHVVELEQDHGGAYLLQDDDFRRIAVENIAEEAGVPEEITSGGGSDGRFFARHGTPFIELGINQESVHGVDESCEVEKVRKLREIYAGIARDLAGD